MRKRFDPSELEPKNGDFASFVDKLNQKTVQELKALQINDELMREQINDELNGAASGVWASPDMEQHTAKHRDTVINQPEDAFKVEIPSDNTTTRKSSSGKAGNASTIILIFLGFALFFYGGMTGDEELILTAVFFVFVSIVSNIFRQKRQRRR